MARDDVQQQAMTSERLAEIRQDELHKQMRVTPDATTAQGEA